MVKVLAFILAILLVLAAAVVFRPSSEAVTANYNRTITIVSSLGANIAAGTASAVTAAPSETVRVVNSLGQVLDSLGGGSSTPMLGIVNVQDSPYNAKADEQFITNAVMAAGTPTLTSVSNPFTSTTICNVAHGGTCTGTADAVICVDQAGTNSQGLCTTVIGRTSSGSITLNANANGTGVNGVVASWGTDNSAAFNAAYTAAGANSALAKNSYGGFVYAPPGRYALGSALLLTLNGVQFGGGGMDATKLFFMGFSSSGGNAGCGNTNGNPDDSAQMLVDGNNVKFTDVSLYSLNNNADCLVYVGNHSPIPANEVFYNVRLATSEGSNLFETAVSGQQNPIGLFVKSVFNDTFDSMVIGAITTGLTNSGFRQGIVRRGVQSSTFHNIAMGLNETNIGLATPVMFDANPEIDDGGGGGNNITSAIDCDAALVCGWNGGSNSTSGLWTGIQGGDNNETNTGFVANYPAEWEPSAAYNKYQFVIPVNSTTVAAGCGAAATTCTPTSMTGLYVHQRIVLPGAGPGSSLNGDVFYINSISAANVITLDHATTNAATVIEWRNYSGHVFRAEANCTSNTTQPAWVTTGTWPNPPVTVTTDNTCHWLDYVYGAFMVNTATAGQVRFDNMNAVEGFFGVLNAANGATVTVSNSFIQAQLDGVTELSGGALSMTGNSFNGFAKASDFLWTDSGSNRANYDNTNFVYASSNAIPCAITNGGTPNSILITSQVACGAGSPTIIGTSGTAYCHENLGGTNKYATCYLNGYAETGSAQTWTYPTAYSTNPLVTSTTCGTNGVGLASTSTVLTLPAGATMAAGSCQIVVTGQ